MSQEGRAEGSDYSCRKFAADVGLPLARGSACTAAPSCIPDGVRRPPDPAGPAARLGARDGERRGSSWHDPACATHGVGGESSRTSQRVSSRRLTWTAIASRRRRWFRFSRGTPAGGRGGQVSSRRWPSPKGDVQPFSRHNRSTQLPDGNRRQPMIRTKSTGRQAWHPTDESSLGAGLLIGVSTTPCAGSTWGS